MKTLILLIILILTTSCYNNHSFKFSSNENKYTLLNFERFGFNYEINYKNNLILEESNMSFYEIKNYKIFENSQKLKDFFTLQYELKEIDSLQKYDDNYFSSTKALIIYYIGSPSYVDTIFEYIEYYNNNLRFYYHSIPGEGLVTNAIIKFNFMIIDLPLYSSDNISFNFIDLTINS